MLTILLHFVSKYKHEIETYLDSVEFNTLSEEEALLGEGLLKEKGCYDALISMPNNTTPGSDGLST